MIKNIDELIMINSKTVEMGYDGGRENSVSCDVRFSVGRGGLLVPF